MRSFCGGAAAVSCGVTVAKLLFTSPAPASYSKYGRRRSSPLHYQRRAGRGPCLLSSAASVSDVWSRVAKVEGNHVDHRAEEAGVASTGFAVHVGEVSAAMLIQGRIQIDAPRCRRRGHHPAAHWHRLITVPPRVVGQWEGDTRSAPPFTRAPSVDRQPSVRRLQGDEPSSRDSGGASRAGQKPWHRRAAGRRGAGHWRRGGRLARAKKRYDPVRPATTWRAVLTRWRPPPIESWARSTSPATDGSALRRRRSAPPCGRRRVRR